MCNSARDSLCVGQINSAEFFSGRKLGKNIFMIWCLILLTVYCLFTVPRVDFQKTLVVCQFAPDTLSSRSSYTRGQPVWSEHIAGVVTTQWRRMLGVDACTIFQKFCNTQPQHRCQCEYSYLGQQSLSCVFYLRTYMLMIAYAAQPSVAAGSLC